MTFLELKEMERCEMCFLVSGIFSLKNMPPSYSIDWNGDSLDQIMTESSCP